MQTNRPMTRGFRHRLRQMAMWAVLAPFLILSGIAPQVVPARAADGVMTMVLCGSHGPEQVLIDLTTGELVDQGTGQPDERCAWACARGVVADTAQPCAPMFLRAAAIAAHSFPAVTVLRHAATTGLPPATGPPAA